MEEEKGVLHVRTAWGLLRDWRGRTSCQNLLLGSWVDIVLPAVTSVSPVRVYGIKISPPPGAKLPGGPEIDVTKSYMKKPVYVDKTVQPGCSDPT
jgi:hypothetical protein